MIVILHNVRSLHNTGSIFRTADAAGVEKIYLTGITPKPVDRFGKPRPQFIKVSLGAEKTVSWEYVKSVTTLIKKLSAEGGSASDGKCEKYKIFAIEQSPKSVPYYRIKNQELRTKNKKQKIAMILGNEVKGLPPNVLKRADKILEIPMRGSKESLNIAVAFGIVVFHLMSHLEKLVM